MLSRFALLALCATASVGSPTSHAAEHFGTGMLLAPASYLGVGVIDLSEDAVREIGLVDPHGIEITSVMEGSPADDAGLRRGDIVLTYRNERVQGFEQFSRLVKETPAGRKVQLGIVRDGQRDEIEVEIGRRDIAVSARRVVEVAKDHIERVKRGVGEITVRLEGGVPRVRVSSTDVRLGAELEEIDGQFAEFFGVERGVLVRQVREASPAEDAGMRAGDVIVAVEGREVRGVGDFGRMLDAETGDAIEIDVVREGEKRSLELSPRPTRDSARTAALVD